jgi:hypothetical protein
VLIWTALLFEADSFGVHDECFEFGCLQMLLEQNVLCRPLLSTLAKVTRQVSSGTGLDNASYLKLRKSKLDAFEIKVLLIIDEIYAAKGVEYSAND